jgi:hypothetical protein
MRYVKKPEIVEAVKLTSDDCWAYWLNQIPFLGKFSISGHYHPERREIYCAEVSIPTPTGVYVASLNDWILTDVAGDMRVCKKCPFCGEDDFDLVGLKAHFLRWCDVFPDIGNPESQPATQTAKQEEK